MSIIQTVHTKLNEENLPLTILINQRTSPVNNNFIVQSVNEYKKVPEQYNERCWKVLAPSSSAMWSTQQWETHWQCLVPTLVNCEVFSDVRVPFILYTSFNACCPANHIAVSCNINNWNCMYLNVCNRNYTIKRHFIEFTLCSIRVIA